MPQNYYLIYLGNATPAEHIQIKKYVEKNSLDASFAQFNRSPNEFSKYLGYLGNGAHIFMFDKSTGPRGTLLPEIRNHYSFRDMLYGTARRTHYIRGMDFYTNPVEHHENDLRRFSLQRSAYRSSAFLRPQPEEFYKFYKQP